MRASTAARLMLGATLLVAGFGAVTDGSPIRGPLAQSVVGLLDLKEYQCRRAPTAIGSACPEGCMARPAESSAGRSLPTECHSSLWIATCGKACATETGFARLPDGALIDGASLIVTLQGEPDEEFRREAEALGVTLTSRFDGLYRYDAGVRSGDIAKIKKRLSALPTVVSAEFVPR